MYSARAFLHFIESAHFILYILAIYILVIKITCTLRPEGGRGVKMPYFDFSICYRAGKK